MHDAHNNSTDTGLISLIRQAQNGSQGSFEQLLERYAPLIESMTTRFCGEGTSVQDREDLRQEAVIAFYRALSRFDVQQTKVQFGLYAKECIHNALVSHLRTVKRHENVVLWDDADCPEDTEYIDPAVQIAEEESYLQLSRRVREALSAYENRIWRLYLSGRTAKEIAAAMGKDERSVHNAVYRIRRKLRTAISELD